MAKYVKELWKPWSTLQEYGYKMTSPEQVSPLKSYIKPNDRAADVINKTIYFDQ